HCLVTTPLKMARHPPMAGQTQRLEKTSRALGWPEPMEETEATQGSGAKMLEIIAAALLLPAARLRLHMTASRLAHIHEGEMVAAAPQKEAMASRQVTHLRIFGWAYIRRRCN